MTCHLKLVLGFEAPCDGNACAYWRSAGTHRGLPEGCVLTHYELIGGAADRTARYLHDYKLSMDRARVAAYLRAMRPSRTEQCRDSVTDVA